MNFRESEFLNALDRFFDRLTPLFVSRFKKVDPDMREKNGGEKVGGLDLEVQERAINFFSSTIGYSVISEEIDHVWPPREKDFVLLDPLDGTHRFLMGSTHCGVMFAIVEKGVVVFSALHLPFEAVIERTPFFYFAVKGSGAYKFKSYEPGSTNYSTSQSPIRTSAATNLSKASIILEGQSKKVDSSIFVRRIKRATQRSMTAYSSIWAATHLSVGSELALPPALMISVDNKPSDNLPCCLLVEEAGGKVTNFEGSHWSLEDCSSLIFAANEEIHRQALAVGQD